ncbi:hypothetical protein [Angustibacter luteus]|uniref:LPXTG cell wall anchor domain-containing protein n=1 Tax=Angustibacter luteus TaxID=658456 RepID=A0ABW1JIY5_9ACTN
MRSTLRRSAAAAVLCGVAVLGGPAVANAADNDYPAPTPSATVSVLPSSSTAPTVQSSNADSPALAYTGTDVAIWLAAGVGLTAGGAFLVAATRKRGARA